MLQTCEVSQDLSSFCAVPVVLRNDQGKLQALMPFKHMPFFAFAAAWAIRGSSLFCYVNTAEKLAFRDSGKCIFLLISTDLSVGRCFHFLTNVNVDGPVLLGFFGGR